MHIESPYIEIEDSKEKAEEFLATPSGLSSVMPSSVVLFSSSDAQKWFSFTVKGMPEVKFFFKGIEQDVVKYSSYHGSSQLEVSLDFKVDPLSDDRCGLTIKIDGEVNAFVRMMIEKPLGAFVAEMSRNIKTQIER